MRSWMFTDVNDDSSDLDKKKKKELKCKLVDFQLF